MLEISRCPLNFPQKKVSFSTHSIKCDKWPWRQRKHWWIFCKTKIYYWKWLFYRHLTFTVLLDVCTNRGATLALTGHEAVCKVVATIWVRPTGQKEEASWVTVAHLQFYPWIKCLGFGDNAWGKSVVDDVESKKKISAEIRREFAYAFVSLHGHNLRDTLITTILLLLKLDRWWRLNGGGRSTGYPKRFA